VEGKVEVTVASSEGLPAPILIVENKVENNECQNSRCIGVDVEGVRPPPIT
jgi:hypothetical protein